MNDMKNKDVIEDLTKKLAKGGGIGFLGRVVGRGLRFLINILFARLLGSQLYGLYVLGENFLKISQTISRAGLHHGITRFGSMYEGEGNKRRLKGTLIAGISFSSIFGLIISVTLFFFSEFIAVRIFSDPSLVVVLKVFSVSVFFYTLMVVLSYSARIVKRMKVETGIKDVSRPGLQIVIFGIAFLVGYRLLAAVYSFLFSTIISTGVGFYFLWKNFPFLFSRLKPEFNLSSLLPYSFTVAIIESSGMLVMRTDRFMLGALSVAGDVGIYNAAAVMAVQSTILLYSFNAIFSPIIADLYNKDKIKQLEELFKISTRWIFGSTLPVALVFILFPKQLLSLFGAEFKAGYLVLIILGVSHLVNASVGSAGFILMMTGRQKVELVNNIVLGSLNILLNFVLIPVYGIMGAGIATGVSISLVNIARLFEVYKLYHMHPYKFSYWKFILAGVLSGPATYFIMTFTPVNIIWVVGILVFLIMYGSVYFLLGLEPSDKVVLDTLRKKLGFQNGMNE